MSYIRLRAHLGKETKSLIHLRLVSAFVPFLISSVSYAGSDWFWFFAFDFSYLAPEYFMHGIADEKTDVFAYGVLLLEIITGRHAVAVDSSRQSLVIWVCNWTMNYVRSIRHTAIQVCKSAWLGCFIKNPNNDVSKYWMSDMSMQDNVNCEEPG